MCAPAQARVPLTLTQRSDRLGDHGVARARARARARVPFTSRFAICPSTIGPEPLPGLRIAAVHRVHEPVAVNPSRGSDAAASAPTHRPGASLRPEK
jgi:hypothetical protein